MTQANVAVMNKFDSSSTGCGSGTRAILAIQAANAKNQLQLWQNIAFDETMVESTWWFEAVVEVKPLIVYDEQQLVPLMTRGVR
jgi:hypothetical protein